MLRSWFREYYMLGRGEQRALLFLGVLLLLSLAVRLVVLFLPGKEPPGMAAFMKEHAEMRAEMERMDSLGAADALPDPVPSGSGDPVHRPPIHHGSGGQPEPVDLNRADSVQLLRLPGIGPVYSGRIIRYRNLLGGYSSVQQLTEVYGLSRETYQGIRGAILIDTAAIRRLAMNGSSFSDLLRHPYLDFEDVKALVGYRDFSGRIGSLQEIRENHLLGDSTLDRMIPYMDFDR